MIADENLKRLAAHQGFNLAKFPDANTSFVFLTRLDAACQGVINGPAGAAPRWLPPAATPPHHRSPRPARPAATARPAAPPSGRRRRSPARGRHGARRQTDRQVVHGFESAFSLIARIARPGQRYRSLNGATRLRAVLPAGGPDDGRVLTGIRSSATLLNTSTIMTIHGNHQFQRAGRCQAGVQRRLRRHQQECGADANDA